MFPPSHWREVSLNHVYRPDRGYPNNSLYFHGTIEHLEIPANAWYTPCLTCTENARKREIEASKFSMEIQSGRNYAVLEKTFITSIDYQNWILVGSCPHCGTIHWLLLNQELERL